MVINPTVYNNNRVSDIFSENLDKGIRSTRQILNGILSENTGKKLAVIEKDTERDFWMNAEEAVKYGIVDRILDTEGGE